MKIDLLTQKKNYIYVDAVDSDNLPYWYPIASNPQYNIRTDNINYTKDTGGAADISFVIGWESISNIDNITLDIRANSSYDSVHLSYGDDDWVYCYGEDDDFASASWYPKTGTTETPIYLNETYTKFKSFECKMIKITFVNCTRLVVNNIEIESDETINISRSVLDPFIFEKFLNNIIPTYKDTDINELAEQTIKMLDGNEV